MNNEQIEQEKPEQLKPENYFPEDIEMLKARLKQEAKKFSHNELARQYVSMYTTLVVLNKDYMELQKVLRSKEQLAELLKTAEQIEINKQSSEHVEQSSEHVKQPNKQVEPVGEVKND